MNRCQACGRSITESEAFARIALGGETYLFCCPMCMSASEAGQLQRRMIPQSFSNMRVRVFVEYVPALQVGGDYACIRSVGEEQLYLIIGDISGHGITSSLLMSRISTEIERRVQAGEDLCLMAEALNTEMQTMLGQECWYLTLFGAMIDFSSQTMIYVNCGHPRQLIWSQHEQAIIRLESMNMPVGLFGPEIFGKAQKTTVKLRGGDKLMLFTDGLIELERKDGSELGETGLIGFFQRLIQMPAEQSLNEVSNQIRVLYKDSPNDDLLFIFVDLKER